MSAILSVEDLHVHFDTREGVIKVLNGIDFEIRGLPTRNQQTASSMVRGKRLDDTHSLRKASERLGHDRSLSRFFRRDKQ